PTRAPEPHRKAVPERLPPVAPAPARSRPRRPRRGPRPPRARPDPSAFAGPRPRSASVQTSRAPRLLPAKSAGGRDNGAARRSAASAAPTRAGAPGPSPLHASWPTVLRGPTPHLFGPEAEVAGDGPDGSIRVHGPVRRPDGRVDALDAAVGPPAHVQLLGRRAQG